MTYNVFSGTLNPTHSLTYDFNNFKSKHLMDCTSNIIGESDNVVEELC